MKKIYEMNLAPTVQAELKKYNKAIDSALDAVQKLEAICVTRKLSEMFWNNEKQTVELLQEDYLVNS